MLAPDAIDLMKSIGLAGFDGLTEFRQPTPRPATNVATLVPSAMRRPPPGNARTSASQLMGFSPTGSAGSPYCASTMAK